VRPWGNRVSALTEVVLALGEAGVAAEDIGLRRLTLDDVFLRLTGQPATTKEAEEAA
jgi:ABC-2 type transport system ATP-binding protein